ncbi:hypothetical protein C2S52_017745 [Perilla frutescens var. hirtella]|nr:hypothetical protein C2S52_017745 [Perilla frutescens var. hirtella]KAH6811500.1 hypothetical protein C2S51_025262 [Perilla frutescens var. frutescens]
MEKSRWGCDQRLMESRDGTNLSFERDRAFGFSWPQRNYKCSFCKKEFKSAQALGGHMNVHRRDRARMRFSPSWGFSNIPNPNPNPNPSLSLSSTWSSQLPSFLPSSPSMQRDEVPSIEDLGKKNEGRGLEFSNFTRRNDARVRKANEFVRLDLSLGLIRDTKEDLDLELRLGSSS